jgi:hypothetical protein
MIRRALLAAIAVMICFSQEVADPWPTGAVVEPDTLAQAITSGKPPRIISVAFPVLYRARHIVHAVNGGPGSTPEGIAELKKAVSGLDKNADLVIYCGCCPMVKCPNVRPAYRALTEMGFRKVRVLSIPTNMTTDWYDKNYPSEPGSAGR